MLADYVGVFEQSTSKCSTLPPSSIHLAFLGGISIDILLREFSNLTMSFCVMAWDKMFAFCSLRLELLLSIFLRFSAPTDEISLTECSIDGNEAWASTDDLQQAAAADAVVDSTNSIANAVMVDSSGVFVVDVKLAVDSVGETSEASGQVSKEVQLLLSISM